MKRNVTVSLDEETARWARLEAARRDTSVSRFIGELLRERMRREASYEEAMRAWMARRPRPLSAPGEPYPSRDQIHDRDGIR